MTALQVRDCPEDVYEGLRLVAKSEGRSIAQETVHVLRSYLAGTLDEGRPSAGVPWATRSGAPLQTRPAPVRGCLGYEPASAREERTTRRRAVLEEISQLPAFVVPDSFPAPEELVREARDAR